MICSLTFHKTFHPHQQEFKYISRLRRLFPQRPALLILFLLFLLEDWKLKMKTFPKNRFISKQRKLLLNTTFGASRRHIVLNCPQIRKDWDPSYWVNFTNHFEIRYKSWRDVYNIYFQYSYYWWKHSWNYVLLGKLKISISFPLIIQRWFFFHFPL